MEKIIKEHHRNFQFIKDYNIQPGTTIVLETGEYDTITHINSLYGWLFNGNRMITIEEITAVEMRILMGVKK